MIMSTVITVENLGKKYTLHHQQREQYTALRDVTTNAFTSLAKKLIHPFRRSLNPQSSSFAPAYEEDFWALKDVSFTVEQGDRIGIIGRNGAGKSTLLKILSRITEPTTGSVRIKGRVASLLEVGTGFHPELTGRENIYLNGAILGMGRAEIRKKFDEIVDFAEIEKFLDTPVKRYSSGMYVRLAFAVAAHLEPEILIVDEVLAVGDAQFQKKCLGKMEDVGREGRTVLFVSHNMMAVSSLCTSAFVLNHGCASEVVSTTDAITEYLKLFDTSGGAKWFGSISNDNVEVLSAEVLNQNTSDILSHKPLFVKLVLLIKQPVYGLIVAWELYNYKEQLLAYSAADDMQDPPGATTLPGRYTFNMEIPADQLAAGDYLFALDLGIHNRYRLIPERSVSLRFRIENAEGIGRRYPSSWTNVFRPNWCWSFNTLSEG